MDQRTKLIVRLREQGVRLSVIRELCGGPSQPDLDVLPMDRVLSTPTYSGRQFVDRNGLVIVA